MSKLALAAALAGLFAATPALAQEQPSEQEMMAAWAEAMTPGPEHQALAAREGTWTATTTYPAGPGSEEMITEQGTAERTMSLDGRVLEERFQGSMMGQAYSGLGRTGFDNVTGEYWTTWTDTMSTGLMVMYGTYDEATATYTCEGTSHHPLMGEIPVKLEHTVESPDRETMVLSMELPGQGMTQMLEIVYERQQ